jgi:O-antigen/teichoic acid export membrane protein
MHNKIREKLRTISHGQLSLARDTIWLIILNILQKTFGLLTTFVLVRALSTTAYGEYNFILTIISLTVVTSLPALGNAILQSVSRGYLGTYKASVKVKFLSSLIGSAFLLGFTVWFFIKGNSELSYGFMIAAFIFPFAYGFTQWRRFKIGQGNFSIVTKTDGISVIITSILIVMAVSYVPNNILIPLLILLLVKAIFDVVFSIFIYKSIKGDSEVEKGSIDYGIKSSLFSILGTTALTIDKIMIFFFLSPASLAIYVAAEKIPELVKTLIKSLAAALAPRFAKHKHYTAKVDNALTIFSFITFIVLVIFAFTLMPSIILLIFGEAYVDAIPYGQALMCITAIGNIAPLKGRFFKSKLDEKSMKEFTVSTSLVRIIASIIFIPLWGLNGAVLSFLIAKLSTNLAVYIIMKKRYPIQK